MLPVLVAEQVREAVQDYLETTFALSDPTLRRALFSFLSGPEGLFKGPYVDLRLPFRRAPEGEEPPLDIAPPFRPYAHQLRAMTRLSSRGKAPQHTLVVTGTGSGKTECFLYPILDHCYRHRAEPGIKALILYPMNALASDQARRIAETIAKDARLRGNVSAGLFVGGEGRVGAMSPEAVIDSKNVLRQSPPDILLTNYKMLDFLLLRPEDRGLWAKNGPETLRYVVLDELHTYDGAQGSDVACLLRRLRARLGAPSGAFACVGTSATVGARESAEANAALRDFASTLFGVTFDEESVIGEDRAESHEVFPAKDGLVASIPADVDPSRLDPRGFDTIDAYVAAQSELWFGRPITDPVELGDELARHALLRRLLISALGGIQSLDDLGRDVASLFEPLREVDERRRTMLLQSFLAMIARARRMDGERPEPLLAMQAQLWIRELRRLLRMIPRGHEETGEPLEPPAFAWQDELEAHAAARALPIVHCRECGVSGFGAVETNADGPLDGNPGRVGEAYLRRLRTARFLLPGVRLEGDLFPKYLCPGCVRVGEKKTCACGRRDTVLVTVGDKLSVARDGRPRRFLRSCPVCGTDGSLRILGARSPSLSSVATTHVFASPFNEDKKLLAFTDSVQDASHLAGFFGARTYRFTVRTVLAGAVLERKDGLRLDQAARAMLEWARARAPIGKVLAQLVPSDLRDLPQVKRYARKATARAEEELTEILLERLSWEATMETGYNALVGRSLERTACIVPHVDEQRLAEAVRVLTAELVETRPAAAASWDASSVRRFAEGVIHRLRTAGGVDHPFLRAYVEDEGAWFHLVKRRNPLMSPYSSESIPFKFFTSVGEHEVFEPFRTPADKEAWVRDWAVRSLGLAKQDQGINLVYEALLKRLVQAGVLVQTKTKRGYALGLDRAAVFLTGQVVSLACPSCGEVVAAAERASEVWKGMPCPRFRCPGRLEARPSSDPTYYGRLYRSPRIERVASAEHTGLLERPAREKLEARFKTGKDLFAPNLLVCTPTLEMGIDIGDLSATMLCSTPRAPASYLQRVGRAGRKTGNALVLSIAEARAHDLYFFTEPTAMMKGEVTPPGCFLDAPEILRRQVIAFAMDAWARQSTAEDLVPRHTGFLFTGDNASSVFPGRLLSFYRANHARLVASFFELFEGHVSVRSRERLAALARPEEVEARVSGAFQGVREEHEELKRLRARLGERLEAIKKEPVLNDELEAEKRDAEIARRVLDRMLKDIERKYPLNVLTDAGVLPNYAFPEPGVMLRSAIRGAKKPAPAQAKRKKAKLQTFEYLRPASAAIRELAPFSTFYAEGRKVKITQIDVGSPARPLVETWRFCRACAHCARELDDRTSSKTCPKCGDGFWSDGGQRRSVVHMKRVSSFSDEIASAIADESEEREMVQYEVMDLVEIDESGRQGARLIPDIPFGWELLTGVTLREINFGPRGIRPASVHVAGRAVQSGPFVVCADCGHVEDPKVSARGQPMTHAPYCGTRKGKPEKKIEVFLYRSVQSEAIRVLLPVAFLDVQDARASFQAALELGLRRKFRGNPTHILFKTMSEPVGDGSSAKRTFLVLYDGVPGGTGYLAELARGDTFLEVLDLALDAMLACACKNDPGKDGCYRCLLAYQSQRDFDSISRRRAIELLSQIRAKAGSCESRPTLSDVPMDSRVESELEARFLRKLAEWARASHGEDAWQPTVAGGQEAYLLSLPSGKWRVELQVELGPAQGVPERQRADFVIRPLEKGIAVPPIVVETDGFAFHVKPDSPASILADDLRKRRALFESERYAVVSLTWKDVEDGAGSSMFADVDKRRLEPVLKQLGCTLPREAHKLGSLALLFLLLELPDAGEWRKLARALAISLLPAKAFPAEESVAAAKRHLAEERERREVRLTPAGASPPAVIGAVVERPFATLLSTWTRAAMTAAPPRFDDIGLVLRLYDEAAERRAEGFEASWMAFLHALNLLQWHGDLVVVSSSELTGGPRPSTHASRPSMQAVRPAPRSALDEAIELADPAYHPLLRACAERGFELPEMGDIADATGRVVATVDLYFPHAKVAVATDLPPRDRQAAEALGYRIFSITAGDDAVLAALAERGTS